MGISASERTDFLALTGMSQWLELWPTHGNVPGSIPGQGFIPGLWVQTQGLAGVNAAGNHAMCLSHIRVSLFLFLLFPST